MKTMQIEKIFRELLNIPSPSGQELEVRKWIENLVSSWGLDTEVNGRNLIVKIHGQGKQWLLCAHTDTVQKEGEEIIVRYNKGRYTSDGKTILGADDKAGVAILLSVAEEASQQQSRPEMTFVFTASEEAGKMSSLEIPVDQIAPDYILNVDGSKPVGTIDYRGLGQRVFEIVVIGKAAHAAVAPEKGKHAIWGAAQIVNELRMGKRQTGQTLNVGYIEGGGKINVIPDKVIMQGEVRAFTDKQLQEMWTEVKNVAGKIATKTGMQVQLTELEGQGTPVWEGKPENMLITIAARAAGKLGLKFKCEEVSACMDANNLARWGRPVININHGGANPHSYEETITLREMEETKRFIIETIKAC